MEIKDTQTILKKLQTYKQSFTINASVVKEWHEVFQDYLYNSVDKRLTEWLKNNSNNYSYPSPYELTRGLTTIDEMNRDPYVFCSICGKSIKLAEYNDHFDRCSSTDYLIRMNIKYFNRKFTREDFNKLSDIQFWTKYWEFCIILEEKLPKGYEKRCLANAILTHDGNAPETTPLEIIGEIK